VTLISLFDVASLMIYGLFFGVQQVVGGFFVSWASIL
jgi:hypothetical protein